MGMEAEAREIFGTEGNIPSGEATPTTIPAEVSFVKRLS
jgi:hypothetical protein